jgi:hypothetical protein
MHLRLGGNYYGLHQLMAARCICSTKAEQSVSFEKNSISSARVYFFDGAQRGIARHFMNWN